MRNDPVMFGVLVDPFWVSSPRIRKSSAKRSEGHVDPFPFGRVFCGFLSGGSERNVSVECGGSDPIAFASKVSLGAQSSLGARVEGFEKYESWDW